MLADGALTFREFLMREPVPLAEIHRTVLQFLRRRDDVVLYGAHAVNAYVDQPRMTQDVDLLSPRAGTLADELRGRIAEQLEIAVRVREVREGLAYRLYQIQKPKNRYLVDVRQVGTLPPSRRIEDVLVVTPEELVAGKVLAYTRRRGRPKAGTDWRDLAMLLLAFPQLKREQGAVQDRLEAAGADRTVFATWRELLSQEIVPEDDDEF